MSTPEKLFSLFAIVFAVCLLSVLIMYPEYRRLQILLPLSLAGLIINIALMFIVLRDVLLRPFPQPGQKYLWLIVLLLFWPALLYYLPAHGFKKRATVKP
jgi:hypothetical protein